MKIWEICETFRAQIFTGRLPSRPGPRVSSYTAVDFKTHVALHTMHCTVEVKAGLTLQLTIDQQPGTEFLDVRATADMTRAFCFGEFGLRGGDRTFQGRLPEGINLLEVWHSHSPCSAYSELSIDVCRMWHPQ